MNHNSGQLSVKTNNDFKQDVFTIQTINHEKKQINYLNKLIN